MASKRIALATIYSNYQNRTNLFAHAVTARVSDFAYLRTLSQFVFCASVSFCLFWDTSAVLFLR